MQPLLEGPTPVYRYRQGSWDHQRPTRWWPGPGGGSRRGWPREPAYQPFPGRPAAAPTVRSGAVKLLVTSSRNPFSLDLVRKLAEQGHDVWASDTFNAAAGSHSRYLAGPRRHRLAPPRAPPSSSPTSRRIVDAHGIDMVLPTFEEAFYLATRHAELDARTTLYTGQFAQLARLHDKVSFQKLADRRRRAHPRDARGPRRRRAARRHRTSSRSYFARAAFSRGGVALLTNTGPLAGQVAVEDCHPSPDQPWLVQEFVAGPMVCTYSTLHDGRVTAHCTYRAPRQWEHSTGIAFLGIDGHPTLDVVERLAGPMEYTGQLLVRLRRQRRRALPDRVQPAHHRRRSS